MRAASLVKCVSWTLKRIMQQDGSASFGAVFQGGGYGVGDDHEPGSRAVVLQGQHHKQTRPRLDYQNQAAEVMLSTRGRSPRVDELPPSSAPDTSPRRSGPFMASWSIFAPARGSKNAAGAAEAHKAAAHPARRRGEERPHSRRRGDGVEALLRHRASPAGSPSAGVCRATLLASVLHAAS